MARTQHEQFTRAAMARAGEDTISAAPDVIRNARGRIGGEFQALSRGRTVPLGQTVTDAIDDIERVTGSLKEILPEAKIDTLVKGGRALTNTGIPGVTAAISGDDAQELRSQLTKAMKGAGVSDNPRVLKAVRSFRDAIDNSIRDALNPQEAGRWDTARRQWANLKVAEAAMKGAGEEAAAGRISPNALAQALKSNIGDDYAAGAGDLNDLARGGQAFMRPIPSSGTAERAMWQGLLTGGPASTMLAYGDPAAAGMWAATTAALPKAAQMAIHSDLGRRVLMNPNANADSGSLIAALIAAQGKKALTRQP
jgi:hypothetical protein